MELTRSDIESRRAVAFSSMLRNVELTDVTLACEDDQIQAHKVILSEASLVFKNILYNNPHKHPLLYFYDISRGTMSLILEFIYSGQIKVSMPHLDKFLRLANALKLKGFVSNGDESVEAYSNMKIPKPDQSGYFEPPKLHNDEDDGHKILSEDNLFIESVPKEEKIELNETFNTKADLSCETISLPNYDELDSKIGFLLEKSNHGEWMCKECKYTSKFKTHVKTHIEQHISGFEQSCNLCAKTFKTRVTYRSHKMRCEKKVDQSEETFEKIKLSDKQKEGHPPLIQDSDTSTNIEENLLQKGSLETNKDAEIYVGKENCEATEPSNQNYEELDKKIKALLVKSDSGIWHCKECNYKSQYKGHVKGHVEKHIPGYIYPCHLCSKMFKRRVNLKLHLSHCGT